MARAKKNDTALTLEEKLDRALVPDWEWPYKLPENWRWTLTGTIAIIRTGKKDANYGNESGQYPFFTCAANPIRCNDYSFDCDAIILAGNGDIGNISKYSGKFEAYQRTYVVEIKSPISIDYIYYYFRFYWYDYNKNKLFGTAIPYIRLGNLQSFPIPLPPFAEQKRIVDRIESLFAKLDEAKEKAQATLDSFETRKATILHKAFTGELTANWRIDNHLDLGSWKHEAFDECLSQMQNGLAKRTGRNGAPFVVLRLANLTEDGFSTDDLRTIVLDEKEQTSYRLCPNDVLMIRVNGSKDNVGKQILVSEQENWAFCDHIIRIRYRDNISPAYMVYFAKSNAYKLYVKDHIVSSAGQNTISRKGMADLSIPVPSFPEQVEIVRILDSFFEKEKKAKEASESVLEQIDLMKKAILSRAFRGELGTNDPNEESALELLKSILIDEKQETPDKPSKRRIVIPDEVAALLSSNLEKELIKVFYKEDGGLVSMSKLMAVSSKKFDVISAIKKLQQKGIIQKTDNGDFKLMR